MKVQEQTKQVKKGLDGSTHSFFTKLAQALQKKIADQTGIQVTFTGKVTTGRGKMEAVLSGQFSDPDPTNVEEAGRRLEEEMHRLKNPTNLIALLK